MSRMLSGAGLCALAIAWIAPASALAAPSWHDGTMKTTTITNCASIAFNNPYQEQGAAAYVGVYEDTNAQPKVGDVYYVHNVVAATGNACSGQYAHIEMTPPPNSVLAISAQNPVICYLINYTGQTPTESRDTQDCPQSPQQGQQGAYAFDPLNNNGNPWPLPQGYGVEIQVPVISRQAEKGTATNPCGCVNGADWFLDGNSSPWEYPTAVVGVLADPPTVSYATPASQNITDTGVRTYGYVNGHYTKGTAYTDLGTTTAYGQTKTDAINGNDYQDYVYNDWTGLTPGTAYHWRLRFVPDGGGTPVVGADQTFTTTGTAPAPGGTGGTGGTTTTPTTTTPTTTTPTTTTPTTTTTTTTTPPPPPPGPTGSTGDSTGGGSTSASSTPTTTTGTPVTTTTTTFQELAGALRLPAAVRLTALRRGLSFTLQLTEAAKVHLVLTAPGVHGSLASLTRLAKAGRLRLRLRLGNAALRRLHRVHKVKLTVTVSPSAGGSALATKTIRLRG